MTRLESDDVQPNDIREVIIKLQQMVIGSKWDKCHTICETMDEYEIPDLNPQPNETELNDLTNGVYRIHQVKSYSKEHQTDLGK